MTKKRLNTLFLKTALWFGMLIGLSVTAYGQFSIHPDCKGLHYTDRQDKNCLACLINQPKKDSLLQLQELQIMMFKDVSIKNEAIITENNKRLTEVTKQRDKANKQLKASVRLTKYGIPISFGVGIIIGILVIK